MQLAIDKARQTAVGTVVVRGSQHVGRVGEYPTMAAEAEMVGMAFVNSYGRTGSVAPGAARRGASPQSDRIRHAERRRLAGHGGHHDVGIPEARYG